MAPRQTKPGKLSDAARHVILPSGVTSTGWPAVRDKCRDFGVVFDEWQDGAGRVILAKRADGSYACAVGGVVISIPRQVGKTFLIAAIVFALCLLNPGVKVLWTAHHSDTATETFQSLVGFSLRKKVRPHVAKRLTDAMTILFRNGSQIMFGARERGFGRGMTKTGLLVFDEAQILTERAAADMVPTTNTVADALVIYTGTPPKPTDPAELFTNRRTEALAGDAEDMAYIEFSADSKAKVDDRKQWAKANPSYPDRTNDAAMQRMLKNLGEDSFRREALGIWDEQSGSARPVIAGVPWAACEGAAPDAGRMVYGIKFAASGETVAVAGAIRPDDGPIHVEGIQHRPLVEGTRWLVEMMVARGDRARRVVVDGRAQAGAFAKALLAAGFPARKLIVVNAEQAVTANGMILTAVAERTVTHVDDPVLADAVAQSGRRPIGKQGGWGFQSLDGSDVSLFEAVVLAHYGAVSLKKPAPAGGRRAVVL